MPYNLPMQSPLIGPGIAPSMPMASGGIGGAGQVAGENLSPLLAALIKQRALKKQAGIPVPGAAVANGLTPAPNQMGPMDGPQSPLAPSASGFPT